MLDPMESDNQNMITMSSYMNYPAHKPFVNTDWSIRQSSNSKAFPESNRDRKCENPVDKQIQFK